MKVKFFRFLIHLIGIILLTGMGVAIPAHIAQADSGTVTQTSYADFAQGCVSLSLNTTHVSDAGGGAVELAATQADDFPGTTLDTGLWTAGLWDSAGAYTPTITNSILSINPLDNAWVRSTETFTHAILETSAQFTAEAYQHIGFGSELLDRYILFSTFTGDGELYARVNNGGGEQNMDLGPIPGGLNRYRIEWTADGNTPGNDLITFTINAAQVAQFSVNANGSANYFLILSNHGSGTLSADYAQAAPVYQTSGTYTGCPFDAGSGNAWQTLSWDASQTMNTSLSVKTRTSPDGINWKDWSDVNNSGDAINQPDRWMEYQLILGTGNNQETPLVNSVSRTFGTAQADLSISKSASASQVEARGALNYYLSVNNQGPNGAGTVTVTDTLPSDVINLHASGSGWDCSASTITLVSCTFASLPVGAAPVITITLNAPAEGGVISNTASTGSAILDPNLVDNTSNTVTTTITALADLSIAKTGPANVNAGGVLSYTLGVSNAGPSRASSLVVSDTLPLGLTNPSASGAGWTCGVASGLLTCTRPGLDAGSAPLITILATAPLDAGDIYNTASVSAATADPVANNTSNTLTTHVLGQADLSIDGSGNPVIVKINGVVTYTLMVSNAGPNPAQNVKVIYQLPAGVVFTSASGTDWVCNLSIRIVTCTLQHNLGLAAAAPLTILVHAPSITGLYTNIFAVSSSTQDTNLANNSKLISNLAERVIYLPFVRK